MLVEAPARDLPETMQRAPQGLRLDDAVVRAHDRSGKLTILEIQVKRTICVRSERHGLQGCRGTDFEDSGEAD
jgi:hypothetical protein